MWTPIALSEDVAAGTAAPARLGGAEIVLWRDGDGLLQAWEDRCPHRGMRLSFGFVREGRLTCLYHGWQFDASARCRLIPAHPELKVPGTIRANPWHVRERAGLVWVADAADADALPALPHDTPMRGLRSLAVRRPRAAVAAQTGIGAGGWIWRDGALIGLHGADDATSMLHLAVPQSATAEARRRTMGEATALRDALEAA